MTSEKKPMQVRPRRRRRLRNSFILISAVLVCYYLIFRDNKPKDLGYGFTGLPSQRPHPPDVLNNLSLTTAQCNAFFPNLTDPIISLLSQGPFTIHPSSTPLLISLQDTHLSILKSQRKTDLSIDMLASRTAALHQLHRAVLTTPPSDPPLPDTLLSLNIQDQPFGTALAYSTQADPAARPGALTTDANADARSWLMPHFSFWAWNLPFVGSMSRAAAAITALESSTPFSAKIPRAVWRGTTWFSSVHNPRLRANLVALARDQPWADVEPLAWDTAGAERTAGNALAIEDFCRYKYVLYTEGVTYSGRFQFLQMCGSVLITPPLGWLQHATHLVRPVFSHEMLGRGEAEVSASVRRAWPRAWGVEEANAVFVRPDWSDLEEVVAWLEAHPREAEGIARRQRETFVGGGYFSPAAETCYWRALVRGWGEVVRWEDEEMSALGKGQAFEAFVLTNGD